MCTFLSCMGPGGNNNFPDVVLVPGPIAPIPTPSSNMAMNTAKPGQPHFLLDYKPGHQGTPAGSKAATSLGMPFPSAVSGGVLGQSAATGKSSVVFVSGIPADTNSTPSMNNQGGAPVGIGTSGQFHVEAMR